MDGNGEQPHKDAAELILREQARAGTGTRRNSALAGA